MNFVALEGAFFSSSPMLSKFYKVRNALRSNTFLSAVANETNENSSLIDWSCLTNRRKRDFVFLPANKRLTADFGLPSNSKTRPPKKSAQSGLELHWFVVKQESSILPADLKVNQHSAVISFGSKVHSVRFHNKITCVLSKLRKCTNSKLFWTLKPAKCHFLLICIQ